MICCSKKEWRELAKRLDERWVMSEERTTMRFTLADSSCAWWLQSNFRCGADSKLVPGWVYGMGVEFRNRLLEGYLDADGSFDGVNSHCGSVSRALIHGVQLLALGLGFNATISVQKSRGRVKIEGREVNTADQWSLLLTKNERREYLIRRDGFGFGKVRSKRWKSGKQYVYDLMVEEDHTYTVNNIVVHNCTAFSVASIGHHWTKDGKPKTKGAKLGQDLARRAREIIEWFPDAKFCIENPRGMLRTLPIYQGFRRETVTYCQYGERRQKPTDIWTNVDAWQPRPACKPKSECHESAPRGARTGTQGIKDVAGRGALPFELCAEIAEVVCK
jgi:hypothetical protein